MAKKHEAEKSHTSDILEEFTEQQSTMERIQDVGFTKYAE